MNITNILESTTIKPKRSVLMVGPSGSMKTITASFFPEPQLWIASNPGQMCGFPLSIWEKVKKNKENVVIKAQNESHHDMIKFVGDEGSNFASIILDDMTYLQHCFLSEKKGQKPKATYDDWGFVLEWSRDIINASSETGAHLVVIALEQIVKEEIEGRVMGLPHVFGAFKHDLPALVRTSLHITAQAVPKGEPKRFVHATPTSIWGWCKDREGILGPEEPHPDWIVKFLGANVVKPVVNPMGG